MKNERRKQRSLLRRLLHWFKTMQIYFRKPNFIKYFLIIVLPSLGLLFVLLSFYHKQEIKYKTECIANRAEGYLAADQKVISNIIHSITTDLLTLARAREQEIITTDDSKYRDLIHDLLIYSKRKKIYDQIRYIDETGQELIRINYNNGQPVVVPRDKLQNKAKRYYFADTIELDKNEIFISPLDLNIEHGQIELPLKPMIRIGTPVFDVHGIKRGILLLNYFGNNLFVHFKQKNQWKFGHLVLLNSEGYWMKSNNPDEEWGFMYEDKQSLTFSNRFPSLWKQISSKDSGQFISPHGLVTFSTIYPMEDTTPISSSMGSGKPFNASLSSLNGKAYFWKIVHHVPSGEINLLSKKHLINLLFLLGPMVVFIAGFSMILATVIMKRKMSHRALKESEHRLAALLAESNRMKDGLQEKTMMLDNILRSAQAVAIATTDLDFIITYYNPMAEKFFGYTATEVIGKTVMEMHMKEEVKDDRFKRALEIVRSDGKFRYSVTQQTATGVRELDSTVTGIFDSDARLVGYSLFAYDVTEHKQQKKELERLQSAIDQASETVIITDSEGFIQYANPAFEKLTGYTSEEVIGNTPRLLKSDKHNPSFYEDMWSTLKRGDVWFGRLINKKKDGSLFEEEATISPVTNKEGQITNYIAVKRDITKEVSLEKQLRQAMKMEAIGTLAGGIAHDFNNILTAIIGYSEMAKEQLPAHDPISEDLDQVILSGRRATELVRQIMTFSRQGEVDREPVMIQPIIKEVLKLLDATLPATIQLTEDLAADSSQILANPTQIHQVVMNICTNAKHAIGDETGKIRVSLSEIQIKDSCQPNESPSLTAGFYLDLCISDTGCGMDESTQSQLFDPFFTTKEVGKGTGLGMAVVHGIIKEHKGDITVSSRPYQGTTFHIYFPVVEDEVVTRVAGIKEVLQGSERILLVDDEPLVVGLMARQLKSFGYKVTAFTHPREALTAFKGDPQAFDILITDMTMPEITGETLSLECLAIRPELPVVLCSGFSETIDEAKAKSLGICDYMQKPIDSATLRETIRRAISTSFSSSNCTAVTRFEK